MIHFLAYQIKWLKIERISQNIQWNMNLRKEQTTIEGWQKYNKIIQQLEQEIKEIK